VGQKRLAAYYSGVSVRRVVIAAFTLGGGLCGLSGILCGAFIGGSMAGPMARLFNISENVTEQNDSASVAKETRLMKTLKHMLKERGYKSKLGTKMGKISNKGLSKLSKKGITPLNEDGSKFDIGKKGYPDNQPAKYDVDGKTIKKDELVDHLLQKGNEKQANKVFGRVGAFKMRVKSWVGKHIKKSFLNKFKLKRNGGLAHKVDKKLKISERLNKFKKKWPKFNSGEAGKKLTSKVNNSMGKAKKGGFVYLLATATCIGVKIPSMVATAVTAIQLLPIVGVAFDTILTPASKAKAAGFGSGFTAEQMDTVGTVLTERGTVEGSKNTEGAAVDSPILMASLGIIKNKQVISDFAPGYKMITSSIVQGAKSVGDKIKLITSEETDLEMNVAGIFQSGFYEYDINMVLIPLTTAQYITYSDNTVGRLSVRLDNPYDAQKLVIDVARKLPETFYIGTWGEQNKALLSALTLEKTIMLVVFSLIAIVAGFLIWITLI